VRSLQAHLLKYRLQPQKYCRRLALQIISLVTLQNYRPPAPEGCPPQLAELIQSCWQADPRARPDAAGVIEALIAYAATLRDSMRPAAPASAPEQPVTPQSPSEQPQ
jgi:hypothetical protein